MGLDAAAAEPTEDYYIDNELYTGVFNFATNGYAWRFGFQSFPGAISATGDGEHKRWANIRFPGFIESLSQKSCFEELTGIAANGCSSRAIRADSRIRAGFSSARARRPTA